MVSFGEENERSESKKMLFRNILYAIIAREDGLIYLNPSQNSVFYHGGAAKAESGAP